MKYYNVVKNWSKIKPHLRNGRVRNILNKDLEKYAIGRGGWKFEKDKPPAWYNSCLWDIGIVGRHPQYFDYVCHAACHWTVNFQLALITLVEPKRKWIIVSSQGHSLVWDGEETLFDFNFMAFKIDPNEAWEIANKDGERLAVGEYLEVGYPEHNY